MNKASGIIIGAIILLCLSTLPAHAQSAEDLFKQGYERYINGQYREALESYSQAASLSPESADAYLWRAKCHEKLGNTKEAIWNLKKALRLNPKLWGAKYLLASLSRGVPERLPSRGNISLEFQDLDVRQAIFALARESGMNLVPSKNLQGKISLSLNNVSTGEALQAILESAQARIIGEGNLLKVVPIVEQPELVTVDQGIVAKTYVIDYVDPANVQATLAIVLPEAEKISAVKDTKYLIVQGPLPVIKRADILIKNIDTPPKQVMVEAKVVELRASDTSSIGLDVKATRPQDANDVAQTKGLAGRPTDTGAQGLYMQVISGNVEAYMSALSTKTGYNLIASPHITTLSGKSANILIGSKYGYKTAIITETSTTQQINFLEVGTSLTITPNVTKDNFIKMTVAPKVSEGQVVGDLPQENTTETANEVMVRDGQTIVIGGLIKDKEVQTDIGVPFLMDIPLLGALFRKTTTSIEKSELVVFVTPRILTPETLTDMSKQAGEMEKMSDQQKARLIH